MDKKQKRILSLFSGCGGMDLGFEGGFTVHSSCVNEKLHPSWIDRKLKKNWVRLRETDFTTIFANDIEPAAKKVWDNYFNDKGSLFKREFYLDSIVDLVKKAREGYDIFPYNIDVVTGGFPCQDFSVAGKRNGFLSHKNHRGKLHDDNDEPTYENRGRLYMWMREVISIVKPKIFIAENVKGLVSLSNVKQTIESDFRTIGGDGYLVVPAKVLKAVEYGVPQTRERVIFIGFLRSALKNGVDKQLENGILDPYPRVTHKVDCGQNMLFPFLQPQVAVKNVLRDLCEPEEEQDDLSQMYYSQAKYYGNHCQGQVEIKLDQPGPTIRAEHHGNIEFRRLSKKHGGKIKDEYHLSERRLTLRECARIQTFPDDYEFVLEAASGTKRFEVSPSSAYKLIGNAVPPLLAYHLAMRLQELWPIIFKERIVKGRTNDSRKQSKRVLVGV